jgi:hypothetical protein
MHILAFDELKSSHFIGGHIMGFKIDIFQKIQREVAQFKLPSGCRLKARTRALSSANSERQKPLVNPAQSSKIHAKEGGNTVKKNVIYFEMPPAQRGHP